MVDLRTGLLSSNYSKKWPDELHIDVDEINPPKGKGLAAKLRRR